MRAPTMAQTGGATIGALALTIGMVLFASAAPVPRTEAALISETVAAVPGRPFTVALRLKPESGWHTYWRNPGDSGMAAAIHWQLPPGFASGPIAWPRPQRIVSGPLVSYGYRGEVLLLTEIAVPATAVPGTTVDIGAEAEWLVCAEICVPEAATLKLQVPVAAAGAAVDARRAPAFAAARAALPQPSPWSARYGIDGETILLTLAAGGAAGDLPADPWFYPYDGLILDHAGRQTAVVDKGTLRLTLPRTQGAQTAVAAPLKGVLVYRAGDREAAVEIEAMPATH